MSYSQTSDYISGTGTISMQDYGYGNTYSFGIFQVDVGLNNTMEISLFSCWEEREGLLSYAIYDKGQWSFHDVDANTP